MIWVETGEYEALWNSLQHFPNGTENREISYLMAEENDFVTGVNLIVDGG
ncbi:hypothetical protein [Peribacillus muralis]